MGGEILWVILVCLKWGCHGKKGQKLVVNVCNSYGVQGALLVGTGQPCHGKELPGGK